MILKLPFVIIMKGVVAALSELNVVGDRLEFNTIEIDGQSYDFGVLVNPIAQETLFLSVCQAATGCGSAFDDRLTKKQAREIFESALDYVREQLPSFASLDQDDEERMYV